MLSLMRGLQQFDVDFFLVDTVGELVLSHCWRNQSRESGPTRLG